MRTDDARAFALALLAKNGVPAAEAATVVDALIEADMKGLGSHGLMRLPVYIRRVKAGLLKAAAELRVVRDEAATAVLDANFSLGQVAGERGMEMAIDKAARFGIGACLVVNSGHFGMASHYGLQAAKKNMVGIVFANTTPLMPPTGGSEKMLGNNPLAIVAPTQGDPIVVDMALSAVAMGKIMVAKNKGEKIPLDWATDKTGVPTDDPAKALDGGLLLPMAGPKGYSLAVALEILTGVLAGSFAWQIPSLYNMNKKQSIAHFFVAIDVARFVGIETYLANVEALRAGLKAGGKQPGVQEIFMPGEIELNKGKAAQASGEINLPAAVVKEMNELAAEAEISPLE